MDLRHRIYIIIYALVLFCGVILGGITGYLVGYSQAVMPPIDTVEAYSASEEAAHNLCKESVSLIECNSLELTTIANNSCYNAMPQDGGQCNYLTFVYFTRTNGADSPPKTNFYIDTDYNGKVISKEKSP